MPLKLFHELDSEKKSRIISAGITEFAQYGYVNSSTNRIVKNAGISKGSLFQYFSGKEDFYFHILDIVFSELVAALGGKIEALPKELFGRIIGYAQIEFDWYIQNPEKFKIVMDASMESGTEIHQKIVERYASQREGIYSGLLEGVDTSGFTWEKQKVMDVLKWFLAGFNADFISKLNNMENADMEWHKNNYRKHLTEYMEMLRAGLRQQKQLANV